jgi:hypothetical protein
MSENQEEGFHQNYNKHLVALHCFETLRLLENAVGFNNPQQNQNPVEPVNNDREMLLKRYLEQIRLLNLKIGTLTNELKSVKDSKESVEKELEEVSNALTRIGRRFECPTIHRPYSVKEAYSAVIAFEALVNDGSTPNLPTNVLEIAGLRAEIMRLGKVTFIFILYRL